MFVQLVKNKKNGLKMSRASDSAIAFAFRALSLLY